jgi:hypothetical protein
LTASGRVLHRVALGGAAAGIAVARGVVYVADYRGAIDPRTRRIVRSIRVHGDCSGVLAVGRSVWASRYDAGTVARYDARTGRPLRTYRVGVEPRGIAAAAGSIWVANQASGTLTRIEQ